MKTRTTSALMMGAMLAIIAFNASAMQCKDYKAVENTIYAMCLHESGKFFMGKTFNWQTINRLIGNDNGQLVRGRDFMKTCKDLAVTPDGQTLSAQCQKAENCSFFGLICSDSPVYNTTTFPLLQHFEPDWERDWVVK